MVFIQCSNASSIGNAARKKLFSVAEEERGLMQ